MAAVAEHQTLPHSLGPPPGPGPSTSYRLLPSSSDGPKPCSPVACSRIPDPGAWPGTGFRLRLKLSKQGPQFLSLTLQAIKRGHQAVAFHALVQCSSDTIVLWGPSTLSGWCVPWVDRSWMGKSAPMFSKPAMSVRRRLSRRGTLRLSDPWGYCFGPPPTDLCPGAHRAPEPARRWASLLALFP